MNIQNLLISVIITILFITPFQLNQIKKGKLKSKDITIIEEAKKAGRIAEGTLIKSAKARSDMTETSASLREGWWFVTYSYEVNGQTYIYRSEADGEQTPPQKLNFYYPKGKPQKAIPEGSNRPSAKAISITIVPVIIWAIVYNILQYINK